MPLYEIVNPSDKCCIEALNDKIAFVAILLLGEGKYGCEKEDGTSLPSLMLFATEQQILQTLEKVEIGSGPTISERLESFLNEHGNDVVSAWESITYCSMSARKGLMAAFEGLPDKVERLAKYNDERRSSLNDIGEYAHHLASAYRKKFNKEKEISANAAEKKASKQKD